MTRKIAWQLTSAPDAPTLLVGGPFDKQRVDLGGSPSEIELVYLEKGEPVPHDVPNFAQRYLRTFAPGDVCFYRHESLTEGQAVRRVVVQMGAQHG